MSHGHFIERCRECGDVQKQCRCPAKDKTLTWVLCPKCAIVEAKLDKRADRK